MILKNVSSSLFSWANPEALDCTVHENYVNKHYFVLHDKLVPKCNSNPLWSDKGYEHFGVINKHKLICIFYIDKHFLLICYYFVKIIVN